MRRLKAMRRRAAAVVLCGMALAPAACKRSAKPAQPPPGRELLSVLPMDDPQADTQLVRGFYSLEGGPWRWTARKFSVILRPPPGAAQDGARLELKLNLPDAVFQQLGAMTLSATAGGSSLAPEKYMEPGNHVYARDVPASALARDSISIEFAADKAIPAGTLEKRELALIVTSVGLVSK
jgi:hypothetical protein